MLDEAGMTRRRVFLLACAGLAVAAVEGYFWYAGHSFPDEKTPEGSYARIVVAISEGRARDCFAYLETEAEWACYTIRDYRSRAAKLIQDDYPEPERSRLLATYRSEAEASDGADVWLELALSRGWLSRLRGDLSGITSIERTGVRATVVTARGTRYTFRQRDNGIWGLTMFTAELLAEAEKASRDFDLVKRSAGDYARAAPASSK